MTSSNSFYCFVQLTVKIFLLLSFMTKNSSQSSQVRSWKQRMFTISSWEKMFFFRFIFLIIYLFQESLQLYSNVLTLGCTYVLLFLLCFSLPLVSFTEMNISLHEIVYIRPTGATLNGPGKWQIFYEPFFLLWNNIVNTLRMMCMKLLN